MSLINNPFSLISLTLVVLLSSFGFFPACRSASDNTNLVYKGCANQTFSDPGYTQTLSALFDSLIAQSTKTKYFKTTSGGGQTSITGLFQCRGDLSQNDCAKCVSKIAEMTTQLCGNTVAGRVQLMGCYGLYEISGFPQVSGYQMLFKTCSRSQAAGSGFEERRDTAFSTMENGILSSNNGGFSAISYQSLYVLGQCEGTLSSGDCANCVKSAVQQAQVECGSSISGQVYLHKCYMSYAYYPNGISKKTFSGTKQNTGKTIAIVVGGVAAVGFAFICLMCLRNLLKKRDDY
ncbi:Cysteine-rich repeat secretory protein [Thalictrum thalictroides]|uniref:Cysteine-rich repeat secretory protein n=1 Tax=Thalictrum thalictroides TaxID=46969 RepID=A0A7J6VA37_THATH|nr:Cysteine-rich repeat secretory protein [Thalictrum thalictroides]